MAIIKRGILGGISGKIANIVGGSWKGIAYIRALPLSVANPNTAAQQAVRLGFKTAVECGRQLTGSFFPKFVNPFVEKMSGFNAFVGANSINMEDWDGTTWSGVIMSFGKFAQPINLAGDYDQSTGELSLTWDMPASYIPPMVPAKSFANNVKKKLKKCGSIDLGVTPETGAAVADIGVGLDLGDKVDVWLMFVSGDGKEVSTSVHIELTAV